MKRRATVSLLAIVAFSGLVPAAAGTENVETRRLAGADRYATAVAIAEATVASEGEKPFKAILANGTALADALSAANVSTNYNPASSPLLLTARDSLPRVTADFIREMGLSTVVVVGDSTVVSDRVVEQIKALGVQTVERIGGADRYATSSRTSSRTYNGEAAHAATVDGKRSIFIASGLVFADAVAASPIAVAEHMPLLITDPQSLPRPIAEVIKRTAPAFEHAFVVGGPTAVSDRVVAQLRELGLTVSRISGDNRQATATALAAFARAEFEGWSTAHVNLARGDVLADAIAGAPHAGSEKAPTLLTVDAHRLGTTTRDELKRNAATISSIDAYGDETAISQPVLDEARDAATTGAQ